MMSIRAASASKRRPHRLALAAVLVAPALLIGVVGSTRGMVVTAQTAAPESWPQWGGPRRDFTSSATGLATAWPAGGPRRLWSRPLGEGHSAVSVADGRVFTMYRPLVASVFANRLRAGMRLQTDPAVIYGLGTDFDGNLRKRDLLADGPYNTYTRAGLPPTPIAMPGAEALRLTLSPPASEYLYFVARGDGSSEFSRNLDEHNRAVARYQKRNKG